MSCGRKGSFADVRTLWFLRNDAFLRPVQFHFFPFSGGSLVRDAASKGYEMTHIQNVIKGFYDTGEQLA